MSSFQRHAKSYTKDQISDNWKFFEIDSINRLHDGKFLYHWDSDSQLYTRGRQLKKTKHNKSK